MWKFKHLNKHIPQAELALKQKQVKGLSYVYFREQTAENWQYISHQKNQQTLPSVYVQVLAQLRAVRREYFLDIVNDILEVAIAHH